MLYSNACAWASRRRGATDPIASARARPAATSASSKSPVIVSLVGEGFDHPALSNPPACALIYHALKLGLEHGQACNPPLDLGQAGASDRVGCGTRLVRIVLKREQGAD